MATRYSTARATSAGTSAWGGDASSVPVSELSADTRADFIKKTYAHLAAAIAATVGLELLIFGLVGEEQLNQLTRTMFGSGFGWLLILGVFMAVSFVAHRWAASGASVATQYAGLGLYVVAQSLILLPLLVIASNVQALGSDNSTFGLIGTACVVTLLITGGITAFAFITGANFNFLGGILAVGGLAALGVIVASVIFGWSLGIFFIGAMIVLMAGFILYETSNVLHNYPVGFHVAASLALYASIATLFWYVLQLLMHVGSDE